MDRKRRKEIKKINTKERKEMEGNEEIIIKERERIWKEGRMKGKGRKE